MRQVTSLHHTRWECKHHVVFTGPPANVACALALWIGHGRGRLGLSMGDVSPSGLALDVPFGYDFP